jgi:enterochelin esterase-like enzyme
MRYLFAAIALMLVLVASPCYAGDFEAFLDRLEKAPEPERSAMIEEFLGSNEVPVLSGTSAYFLYCDEGASSVSVAGDFNGWKPGADMMTRLPGTCLYFLKKDFEEDARLDYKFVVNGSAWMLDPLNPARVTGGFGPNSELSMPGYLQPVEIIPDPDIQHGKLITQNFPSKVMEATRQVHVYLPAGYDESGGRRYPVLFVHDGKEYATLGSMVNVADNMIAAGDIDPLVIVFIDPNDRNSEYKASDRFGGMIVTEVVPWVEEKYRVESDPALRGMMGASLGGLISVYITWNHSDLFGFCASQSGAFFPGYSRVIEMVEEGPHREIRYYLDWGTYESEIAESNEEMRDALLRGGYELEWHVYHEGHSWGSWRAHVDDILRDFAGK